MGGGEGFDRVDEFVSCWRSAVAECVSNQAYHRLRLDLLSFVMVGGLVLIYFMAGLMPEWLRVLVFGSYVAVAWMLVKFEVLLERDKAMIERERMFSDSIGLR
jgi:hypothetical protein